MKSKSGDGLDDVYVSKWPYEKVEFHADSTYERYLSARTATQ